MDSKQFDALVARLASGATRRDAVKGVLGGTLASVGVTSVASARKGKANAEKNNKKKCTKKQKRQKVEICHKGQTITVSKCGWKRGHKKHGDTLGPCYG